MNQQNQEVVNGNREEEEENIQGNNNGNGNWENESENVDEMEVESDDSMSESDESREGRIIRRGRRVRNIFIKTYKTVEVHVENKQRYKIKIGKKMGKFIDEIRKVLPIKLTKTLKITEEYYETPFRLTQLIDLPNITNALIGQNTLNQLKAERIWESLYNNVEEACNTLEKQNQYQDMIVLTCRKFNIEMTKEQLIGMNSMNMIILIAELANEYNKQFQKSIIKQQFETNKSNFVKQIERNYKMDPKYMTTQNYKKVEINYDSKNMSQKK